MANWPSFVPLFGRVPQFLIGDFLGIVKTQGEKQKVSLPKPFPHHRSAVTADSYAFYVP